MRRHAFTLVEMLVSMALVLFVMVILSQALSIGLETFRQLKATGELEERLRMASTILRQDLKLDHFEGKRRLSDPDFWRVGPPREGFFRIEQGPEAGGLPILDEGKDGDQIPSYRATNHKLHFAIKLRGSLRDSFLSTQVPVGSPLTNPLVRTTFTNALPDSRYQDSGHVYNSQWAEVAYFLVPNGAAAGGTPLYALYRRERLVCPNTHDINWVSDSAKGTPVPYNAANIIGYAGMSCGQNPKATNFMYFNDPTDLTVPERRFGTRATPLSPSVFQSSRGLDGSPSGDDLLLTDVVSFTVQVLSPDLGLRSGFTTFWGGAAGTTFVPFDTWSTVQDDTVNYSSTQPPRPISISALQIIVRIYDSKSQQTRQVTIIQDM